VNAPWEQADSQREPEWGNAERAAAMLREAIRLMGRAGEVAGTRAVRNVVQRPCVQFGTMPAAVACELAELLSTRAGCACGCGTPEGCGSTRTWSAPAPPTVGAEHDGQAQ
jgi:hypothetical protein